MIINVHHLAEMVIQYLKVHDNFGLQVEISREELLLDTGGGLKKASWFFLQDPNRLHEPFILHNVDVVSTIDFRRMLDFHNENHTLATLAVQERESSRYLLFDVNGELCGRRIGRNQEPELVRSTANLQASAFSGIHVISPRLLTNMTEEGVFSIIATYPARLAGLAGREKGMAFRADEYYWRDLGKLEDLRSRPSRTSRSARSPAPPIASGVHKTDLGRQPKTT